MAFEDRLKKTQCAINRFEQYCINKNIDFAYSGYEHWKASNKFYEKLIKLEDNTSKRIRYFPDIVLCNKKSWLIEIKNSITIERDAYLNYIDLKNIGYNVGIVFLNNKQLLFCGINNLKFKIPNKINIPIIDKYWLAPRKLNESQYQVWKSKHPKASGTTFAYIDFKKTNFIELI